LICENVYSIDIRQLVKCGHQYSRYFNPVTGQHEAIQTTSTPCHLGGSRHWFLCPRCNNRCAILYANKSYACRKCHGLRYSVERQGLKDRAITKCIKFRERYGLKEGGTIAPFPAKPKLMCWHTYFKAREIDRRLREQAFGFTAKSRGYPECFMCPVKPI